MTHMPVDSNLLVCLHCAGPLAKPGHGGILQCTGCDRSYPVLHGVPVMLDEADQQSSILSAETVNDYILPPFEPSLDESALTRSAAAKLGRRAIRSTGSFLFEYGRRSLGLSHAAGYQTDVKQEYETRRETSNDFLMCMERAPMLLHGRLREATLLRFRQELARIVLASSRKVQATRVLEVGCGTGVNVWSLDHFYPDHQLDLCGFDFSYFRAFLAQRYISTRFFFNGDAKCIALPEKSVDLAFTSYCLEKMRYDNLAALKEMARVARYVLLVEPIYEYQNRFGKMNIYLQNHAMTIRDNAQRAGLRILESRRLGLGHPFMQAGLVLAEA